MPVLRQLLSIAAVLFHQGVSAQAWVHASGTPADFALAGPGATAQIVVAPSEAKAVGHAAHDLAADIERVTGHRPEVRAAVEGAGRVPAVLVGTLGTSEFVDALAAAGKLDVRSLRGAWESFVIATVEQPLPGVPHALAIIGSDPRGTAFGVYELSQAIGVSPWYWWADVAPAHRDALYVSGGTRRFGPPSVKYRGVFLNDEDWGLQAWAAKTFEPEHGGIGPKTYARLFELLLRLKANTVWPAMHPGTPPFNSNAANAALADEYGIVMGSSHAEPMLRNNVGEWQGDPHDFNYLSNRDGVLGYWEERVASNGRFDSIYTLGMRGIHDGVMQGPKSDRERAALLEQIISDQRALLTRYVNPQVEQVPQLFVPYKEVLAQYRQGLKVPEDVTVMWTDDNFGYLRRFTSAEERARRGGFGVYYHLSYLGAPLSYLWLSTTPPALVWEEMTRAYEAGARRIWIANVGDLKPAEIDTEFFLQMAWDVKRWRADQLPQYLVEWATREFGAAHAREIASIMEDYYRLNYRRRPEHLQWWLPKEAPRHSAWTAGEAAGRLHAFVRLRERVEALQPHFSGASRDAWFELVAYPVIASALANERFIEGERGNREAAMAANARLDKLTGHWNTGLAGGKWRHIMQQELPGREWASMRLAGWTMPDYAPARLEAGQARRIVVEAEHFDGRRASAKGSWQVIPGLGHTGDGAVALGAGADAVLARERIATDAPRLDYRVRLPAGGAVELQVALIPTNPTSGSVLRVGLALDDGMPQVAELQLKDGGPEWAQGVLDNMRVMSTTLAVPSPGRHVLHLYGIEPGVIVDSFTIVSDGQGASR
jgi:hypothetical protein